MWGVFLHHWLCSPSLMFCLEGVIWLIPLEFKHPIKKWTVDVGRLVWVNTDTERSSLSVKTSLFLVILIQKRVSVVSVSLVKTIVSSNIWWWKLVCDILGGFYLSFRGTRCFCITGRICALFVWCTEQGRRWLICSVGPRCWVWVVTPRAVLHNACWLPLASLVKFCFRL